MAKIIKIESEGDDDGKLYHVTDEQYQTLKSAGEGQLEDWPDHLNSLLDEICKPENEVKIDGAVCTVGDCWGFWHGDDQVWGR